MYVMIQRPHKIVEEEGVSIATGKHKKQFMETST